MGALDHKPYRACGTWCPKTGDSCQFHTECWWCGDRWPCDTAMTREDIAKALLDQPVLADHYASARIIAPWLPEFNQEQS